MTSSKWDIHGMHITGIEDEQYDNMSGVWKWVTHLIVCQNQGLTASCFGKMRDWHQWNILVEHFNIHHLVYKYHTLCICHNIYIHMHISYIPLYIHIHISHDIPIIFPFLCSVSPLFGTEKNDPKDVQQIFGAALKKEGLL